MKIKLTYFRTRQTGFMEWNEDLNIEHLNSSEELELYKELILDDDKISFAFVEIDNQTIHLPTKRMVKIQKNGDPSLEISKKDYMKNKDYYDKLLANITFKKFFMTNVEFYNKLKADKRNKVDVDNIDDYFIDLIDELDNQYARGYLTCYQENLQNPKFDDFIRTEKWTIFK